MIEPVRAPAALAEAIRTADPGPGSVELWRLGQAGLVVRFPGTTVLIDPYLSNHCEAVLGDPFDHRRLTRAPLEPVDLDTIDVLLCTHDHLDHLDPPTVRTLGRQNPQAVVVAPTNCRAAFAELGWAPERFHAGRDATTIRVGELSIECIAVPHEEFEDGPDGNPYLGYVVSDGRTRIAHLGDALADPRVVDALRRKRVDVLALPINGRSARRREMGFAGNMNAEEAVALAADSEALLTVPIHYDMFAQNVDADAVGRFRTAARERDLATAVLAVGERLVAAGSADGE